MFLRKKFIFLFLLSISNINAKASNCPKLITLLHTPGIHFIVNMCTTASSFGAAGDGVTDDTYALLKAFSSGQNLDLEGKKYLIDLSKPGLALGLIPNDNTIIEGNGAEIILKPNNMVGYSMITLINSKNVKIFNLKLIGDVKKHFGSYGEWGMGFSFLGAKNCELHQVEANEMWGDGFYLSTHGKETNEGGGIFNSSARANRRVGLSMSGSKNFTIKDCNFENTFYAFIIQKAKYGLLQNNKIFGNAIDETSSGNGIHIWKSKNIRIEGNTIESMRDGIYLEFVENSSISNNRSINNIRYGLHFMFAHHNEFNNNEFKTNGAGVAVMFSKFIHMHHNTFHFNWGNASYGLLLKEINDATIENNYFDQNTIGINVDGCNRIKYSNNHFVRNGWAIKFNGGCYDNLFEYNNFLHNSFDLSYNSKLNSNKFEANYWSEYTGYDLDKDGIGDVPYRPVKLFSYIVNQTPEALVLLRSLFIDIINFSEKVSPVFTPDNLVDEKPIMRKIADKF